MYKQGLVHARGVGRESSKRRFLVSCLRDRKVLRAVSWRFLLLTAAISTLACSSQRVVRYGPHSGGHLITVRFTPDLEKYCSKAAIACVDPQGEQCTIITKSEDPEVIIHEVCHCLVRALRLEIDTCHDDVKAGQHIRDRRYDVR